MNTHVLLELIVYICVPDASSIVQVLHKGFVCIIHASNKHFMHLIMRASKNNYSLIVSGLDSNPNMWSILTLCIRLFVLSLYIIGTWCPQSLLDAYYNYNSPHTTEQQCTWQGVRSGYKEGPNTRLLKTYV